LSVAYLVALAAVCTAVIGALAEAVLAVSRRPVWAESRPRFSLADAEDRRRQSLPFVGADRRRKTAAQAQREKLAA